jgi:hypothetical protein
MSNQRWFTPKLAKLAIRRTADSDGVSADFLDGFGALLEPAGDPQEGSAGRASESTRWRGLAHKILAIHKSEGSAGRASESARWRGLAHKILAIHK